MRIIVTCLILFTLPMITTPQIAVNAPMKGFYTFGHPALDPLFEEPERLREILVKNVLNMDISIADSENTEQRSGFKQKPV